jgi:hypothetical protein
MSWKKVLSKFNVDCSDDIKCIVDENNLIVAHKKVDTNHKITFTKSGDGEWPKNT